MTEYLDLGAEEPRNRCGTSWLPQDSNSLGRFSQQLVSLNIYEHHQKREHNSKKM